MGCIRGRRTHVDAVGAAFFCAADEGVEDGG